MPSSDVVIFFEDPGAANMLVHLPRSLKLYSLSSRTIVDGHGIEYVNNYDLSYDTPKKYNYSATSVLSTLSPNLIVVGTSENKKTFSFDLIIESRKRGIKTIGVIDSPVHASQRFKGTSDLSMKYMPDYIFVRDKYTKNLYVHLGCKNDRVFIIGSLHDEYIKQFTINYKYNDKAILRNKLAPGSNKMQPIFVFASEISDGLDAEEFQYTSEYTIKGRQKSTKRTHIAIETFLDALGVVYPNAYKILRLHPKDNLNEYKDYTTEFQYVSQGGSPYELLYVSDMVVGLTSMLLYEAYLMGKKVLSILPREKEKNWLVSDKIKYVSNYKALVSYLNLIENFDNQFIDVPVSTFADSVFHVFNKHSKKV